MPNKHCQRVCAKCEHKPKSQLNQWAALSVPFGLSHAANASEGKKNRIRNLYILCNCCPWVKCVWNWLLAFDLNTLFLSYRSYLNIEQDVLCEVQVWSLLISILMHCPHCDRHFVIANTPVAPIFISHFCLLKRFFHFINTWAKLKSSKDKQRLTCNSKC